VVCIEPQEDLHAGFGVAIGSKLQPAPQRPRTRIHNNTSKPKNFGGDFVCLMMVIG
jgi:hypothetical protein